MAQRSSVPSPQAGGQDLQEGFQRIAVPSTAENRERVHAIFAYQSSLLQNIAGIEPGNFQIDVLSEPFLASRPEALDRLDAREARSALRQYLALRGAAQEWNLDFIDFSQFQVLPGGRLRFPWRLQRQELPAAAQFVPLFRSCRHLRGLTAGNYHDCCRGQAADAPTEASAYLCRRDDCSSNLLRSRFSQTMKPSAGVKVRVHTKLPWQKQVVVRNFLHNLSGEETLLLRADLARAPLAEHLRSLCGCRPARDMAAIAREFRLFLTKSVYQEAVLLVDRLERLDDDRLLRYLLESGEVPELSAVLLDDSVSCECDLEFYEDPPNLLERHLPGRRPRSPGQDGRELLRRLALLEVPVPRSVAILLAGANGAGRIASLLASGLLRENREQGTLEAAGTADPSEGDAAARNQLLADLAGRCDWPYARIALLIANGRLDELEECLRDLASSSPPGIAFGSAAELLCCHLVACQQQAASGSRILEHGLDVLIRGNRLDLAGRVLAGLSGRLPPVMRLKKAHLAMRRKEYRELGRLLAGMEKPPDGLRDEWLYLNFILSEKASHKDGADHFVRQIRSPYFRNLARLQLSDRAIYQRDYARARALLAQAAGYFAAAGRLREAAEARSQLAKLLREEGDFAGAESAYKTIYVESEAEGSALSAAAAAVDLGNLYLEKDDDFQAECWYQKARRLYVRERNSDGLMLVNANLVNVFLAKGEWLEADRLLVDLLAWDEEKQLPNSLAIDLLNQASLEALRFHDDRALALAGRAEEIFKRSANRKGLGECSFLRARLACPAGDAASQAPAPCAWLSRDQQTACRLLGRPLESKQAKGLFRELAGIRSRKTRFETLRLLLRKHRRGEWLGRFKELALSLSPKGKNYFYYEYWYALFDLAPDEPPGDRREELLAMIDFFTLNGRRMPAKFARLRQQSTESESGGGLFADARLVERSRQWRLPVDFFRSFLHEIGRDTPADWLAMAIHETPAAGANAAAACFRFASSEEFAELGSEMLRDALAAHRDQNLDLPEVRRRYGSPERFFYPFACTKLIRWPLADRLVASLAVAYRDGSLHFQDFAGRQRETLRKFSALFQNFLQNELRVHEKLEAIVGESEAIRQVKRKIAQVSKVDFSLLITGESGCGKELVAKAVHRLGPRAGQPFIPLNAAAIPETLLEAELFGFRKGAFSGASQDRVGMLEAANRGTLFLDEIADLPLPLQAKLLRALQEREIRRLGENRAVQIDVRLISATNRDLNEMIRQGLFRADLFYRLQDLQIHIPPLRERREDIPLLIGSFLKNFGYSSLEPARLSAIADRFRDDPFPGNVRELESKIKGLITFHPDLDLPAPPVRTAFSLRSAREEFDRNLLRRVLAESGGRRGQAAQALGISRMALFNLIKKYGIDG